MSIVIQSHHYTINFNNVNYFRAHNDIEGLTVFKMNNGRSVIITCPYDEVIAHMRGWSNLRMPNQVRDIFIKLEYGDDTVDDEPGIEQAMEGIVDEMAAVVRN